MIIGITGKSGSGKSTFAKLCFKNAVYIEVDSVAHDVMLHPDIRNLTIEKFNLDPLKTDRKIIGDLYFNNRNAKAELDKAAWSLMQKNIDSKIDEAKTKNKDVVIDWILLPHSKYWKLCDITILMTASLEQRKQDVLIRDNITEEYFNNRESHSISYSDYNFTYIINR